MGLSLRTVNATRYVTPLREGGSLPAIVEADDDGLYVLKFRGAGQGPKALVAELVAGEIGRALDLPVPEIVLVELDPALAGAEPDPEIQDLLKASVGLNLALDYLPGSITYDPLVDQVDADLAARVVWFDALVTNIDRTPRNANLLTWHKELYLIDHGAALYFHHAWTDYLNRSRTGFAQIKDHVLLPRAGSITGVDAEMAARLSSDRLREVINAIPELWLASEGSFESTDANREAYFEYLTRRLEVPRIFAEEAERVRTSIV